MIPPPTKKPVLLFLFWEKGGEELWTGSEGGTESDVLLFLGCDWIWS